MPTPVASPVGVIEILVTSDDDQVTLEVMSRVEPSLKVPVAVNCCWVLMTITGFAGVTAIDFRFEFVTVSVAA